MKNKTFYISSREAKAKPYRREVFPKGTTFIAMNERDTFAGPLSPAAPASGIPVVEREFWNRIIERQKGIV